MKSYSPRPLTLDEMFEELENKVEMLKRLCANHRTARQAQEAFQGIERRANNILAHSCFEMSGISRESVTALVDRARSHLQTVVANAEKKQETRSIKIERHRKNRNQRAEEQRRAAHDRKYGRSGKAS